MRGPYFHNVYKCLLILKGTLPNASRSGKVTILTDDNSLTYDDVMDKFVTRINEGVNPFEIVYVDWE
jgi:hypothetical protein